MRVIETVSLVRIMKRVTVCGAVQEEINSELIFAEKFEPHTAAQFGFSPKNPSYLYSVLYSSCTVLLNCLWCSNGRIAPSTNLAPFFFFIITTPRGATQNVVDVFHAQI